MKVIDRTPLRDRQGNITLISRVQGTLTYGLDWIPELDAQKKVIAQFDRLLDKGYVLIQNFSLPESEIMIPIILIGPGSFNVIFVTPLKGHFQARGLEWNTVDNKGNVSPARRNPIDLLVKLSRAVQKYLQIHNISVPMKVDPVLIASDPGANIESADPAVRIVRSDAISTFAKTLNSSAPILRAEQVLVLADLILEPQLQSKKSQAESLPPQVERPISRAQAIFRAAEEANPPRNLQSLPKANPAKPAVQPAPRKRAGLSVAQILILAGMGLLGCCVIGGLIYYLFLLS